MAFQEGPNEGANGLVRWEELRDAAEALRKQSGLSTLRNDPRVPGPQPRPGTNPHAVEQFFRLDSLAPSANADRPQNSPPLLDRPDVIKFRKQAVEAARAPNATWDQQMTAVILEYYPFREALPPDTPNINAIQAGANMQITRILTNIYGVTEFLSTLDLYWRFLERNPAARTQPPRNTAIESRLLEDARTLTALMPYWGRVVQLHFITIHKNGLESYSKELQNALKQLPVGSKQWREANVRLEETNRQIKTVSEQVEEARKQLIQARNDISTPFAEGLPTGEQIAKMDVNGLRGLTETITPVEGRMREIMFTRTEAITMPRHNPTAIENLARRIGGADGEKRAREILSGVGLSEAPMKAIQARQVHAAYINLLTQHRSAQSEQFIGKVAAGNIAPEQVANMFRDHQQIGQLIMQEHLFGLQTTAAHMYAGTLGVSTTLQQNPERRLADFTPEERDKIFKQYLEMLAAVPQGQQQVAMKEQREKSAKALQNYIRCMREEALQLRVQLRVVDVIYIQPAVQSATDGINAINAFMESITANALNWVIWGPILSYYYPSLHDLVGVNANLPTIRNRLEVIRKNAQQERDQLQSLRKTIAEAREALERAEEDLAGPLKIITDMQAGDVLDPARIKAAQDALKQITQIQETIGKTMMTTWNRIEINQKHHAETAAALADAEGAYRRMALYAYTAAGIVVGGYAYSYTMVHLSGASRVRYLGNAAFPVFSPVAQVGWDTFRGVRAAVNWTRGTPTAAAAETVAASPAAIAEANRLRRLGELAGRLTPDTRARLTLLTPRSNAMQRFNTGLRVLNDASPETFTTLMRNLNLTDGAVKELSEVVMRAHEIGQGRQFYEQKIQILVDFERSATGRRLLNADQWQAFRAAFLRSGVCGSVPLEVMASADVLRRLSPGIRAMLASGRVSSSQALRILAMCEESQALLRALNALPEEQLQQVLRILGSPAMREFNPAALDAKTLEDLIRRIGMGTHDDLRNILRNPQVRSASRFSRALTWGGRALIAADVALTTMEIVNRLADAEAARKQLREEIESALQVGSRRPLFRPHESNPNIYIHVASGAEFNLTNLFTRSDAFFDEARTYAAVHGCAMLVSVASLALSAGPQAIVFAGVLATVSIANEVMEGNNRSNLRALFAETPPQVLALVDPRSLARLGTYRDITTAFNNTFMNTNMQPGEALRQRDAAWENFLIAQALRHVNAQLAEQDIPPELLLGNRTLLDVLRSESRYLLNNTSNYSGDAADQELQARIYARGIILRLMANSLLQKRRQLQNHLAAVSESSRLTPAQEEQLRWQIAFLESRYAGRGQTLGEVLDHPVYRKALVEFGTTPLRFRDFNDLGGGVPFAREVLSAHPNPRQLAEAANKLLMAAGAVEVVTWVADGRRESIELSRPEAAMRIGTVALHIRRGNDDVYVRMIENRLMWSAWGNPVWVPIEQGRYDTRTNVPGSPREFMNQLADDLMVLSYSLDPTVGNRVEKIAGEAEAFLSDVANPDRVRDRAEHLRKTRWDEDYGTTRPIGYSHDRLAPAAAAEQVGIVERIVGDSNLQRFTEENGIHTFCWRENWIPEDGLQVRCIGGQLQFRTPGAEEYRTWTRATSAAVPFTTRLEIDATRGGLTQPQRAYLRAAQRLVRELAERNGRSGL